MSTTRLGSFLRSGRQLAGLLSDRVVLSVAATSVIARLPKGLLPLAVVLLVHERTGAYVTAGICAAALAVGDGLSAPWQGRLVDRYGRWRVLVPVACVLAVSATGLQLAAGHVPRAVLMALCVLTGVGMPPVSGVVKAVWPALAPRARASTVYTLESLLQQVVFAVGPLLAATFVTVSGPAVLLDVAAGCAVAGSVGFVVAAAAAPHSRSPGKAAYLGALRRTEVRVIVAATMLQGMMLGVRPVALSAVAIGVGIPALVGVLQCGSALGGLLGSLLPPVGARRHRYVRLHWILMAALLPAVLLSAAPTVGTAACLAATLVVPGVVLTPLSAASYALMDRFAAARHRTEAFTWMSSGLAVGTAAGSTITGWVLDLTATPVAAFAAAPLAVAIAAMVARYGLRRTTPDNREGKAPDGTPSEPTSS